MKKISAVTTLFLCCLLAGAAHAADASGDNVEAVRATVLNLIRALVDQGVIGAGKAQDMLRQAGLDPALLSAPQVSQAAPPAAAEPVKPVVRVPYLSQTVKDELRAEVRQEALAQAREERWGQPGVLPEWMSRLNFFGDMRIRYQREQYPGDNAIPQQVDAWYQLPVGTIKDTFTSRQQEVIRARVGVEGKMGDDFTAKVRFVAVNGDTLTASPVTYNVDEASYGRPISAGIDLASVQWQPRSWSRMVLGRMTNPYLATDLIFASDLSFDGIAASLEPRITQEWSALTTVGMHPLTSNWVGPYNSASNQWLYAAQLGVKWKAANDSNFQLAAAYYDYVGLEGQPNPGAIPQNTLNALSAPPFRIVGNTMFNLNWFSDPNATPVWAYAAKFRLASAFLRYELARFDPVRISLTADWVRNTGFNAHEITTRIGSASLGLPVDANGKTSLDRPRVTGYRIGFNIGSAELHRLGDWQVFGGYRYLERDAVPDAFTSLDYRLGGTDQRATVLGFIAGLSQRTSLRVFVTSAKAIDAPIQYGFDTWFVDLYGSF
jgi:hypothetical protein